MRTTLFLAITGSTLPTAPLSWFQRSGLLGYRLVASTPGVVLVAICITAIDALSPNPRLSAKIATWCCWAIALGMQLFSFASWAAFYSMRQFLDAEAWMLALSSPSLVLAHIVQIAPAALVIVPLVAVAVLAIMVRLCRMGTTLAPGRERAIVHAVGAVMAVSITVAWFAHAASERDRTRVVMGIDRPPEPAHVAFTFSATERSGPVARVLADAWDAIVGAGTRLVIWGRGSGEGPPIITFEEYARRLDPRSVRHWNVVVVIMESLRADELTPIGGRRA